MRQNSLVLLEKLKKLLKTVEANPELTKTVEERVYRKLIEHVSRVQEAIQSCRYREFLDYKTASIKNTTEINAKLANCEMLKTMSELLGQILQLPPNLQMNPSKHWLNEQWKKADVALQMETAISVLKKHPDDLLKDLCKTVIFSEKNRQAITKTTKKTIELTKAFSSAENDINRSYYKSISEFQYNVLNNQKAKL